jgi:AcrR family transcriptional regulator
MSSEPLRATESTHTPAPVKRRGRDRRFTVDEVLEAALALIDDEGLDALTMRRLAEELGVSVMSLYGYVRTKEEIVDGVYGLALERLNTDLDRDAPWDEQLTTAIRHVHTSLHAHPGLVELLIARSVPGSGIDLVRENLIGILRRAGFPKREALQAHGACMAYAMGFAVAERARPDTGSPSEQFARLRSLPPEEFPYLSEVAAEYGSHLSGDAFEYGLAHLVGGLRKDLDDTS